MKKPEKYILLLVIFFFAGHAWGSGWILIRETETVKVYSKDVAGSDLIAFKGDTVLPAGIGTILGVIRDQRTWPDWIEMFDHGTILEQKFPQKFLIKAPRAPMQGP